MSINHIPFHTLSFILLYIPTISSLEAVFGLKIPGSALVSAVCLSLLFITTIYKQRVNVVFTNGLLIFFALYILTIIYYFTFNKPEIVSPMLKFLNFLYVIIIPCLIIILQNFFTTSSKVKVKQGLSIVYIHTLINSIIFGGIFLLFAFRQEAGRLILDGLNNPIWVARHLGYLIIMLCISSTYVRNKKATLLLIVSLFAGIISVGARAPFAALIIVLTFYYLTRSNLTLKKKINFLAVGMLLILLGSVLLNSYSFSTSLWSLTHRQWAITFALEQFYSDPMVRYGEFGLNYLGEDIVYYPHNLFAELLYEFSFVGVILCILVVYIALRQSRSTFLEIPIYFAFLNAMFSGDLNGNAQLFYLISSSVLMRKYETK